MECDNRSVTVEQPVAGKALLYCSSPSRTVDTEGLEPPTSCESCRYSSQLSYVSARTLFVGTNVGLYYTDELSVCFQSSYNDRTHFALSAASILQPVCPHSDLNRGPTNYEFAALTS